MLRISFVETCDNLTLKLEGSLAGDSVYHLKALVQQAIPRQRQLEVDMRGITFVDGQGEQLLVWLYRMGARFHSGSIYIDALLKILGIPASSAKRNEAVASERATSAPANGQLSS